MAQSDTEIVVEDPTAPEDESPPVSSTHTVEIVTYLLLIGLAIVLGLDNRRLGAGWSTDGPQPGYMPFYLCVILGGASLFGLVSTLRKRGRGNDTFVTRAQLRRVAQVFFPTLAFCIAMQWLGLYVASFLLVAGFMRFIGRIAWWKCIVTAFLFAIAMFVTFDVAFDVIMPKGPLERAFGY